MFLAALLTVIGYSINDTVVVFHRIREQRRLHPSRPFAQIANDACLQTVRRTVNTGLGAMFVLVALYILGGESLTDFVFALLIGTTVGSYSSVFTAAPLAVALESRTTLTRTPPAAGADHKRDAGSVGHRRPVRHPAQRSMRSR